jgi:uncharacterized protein YdaU (DUF1376 family)
MNYYPFHIGDYVSATRHLSWEEDAAYRRLLDTYYMTEKPLPAELRAVCRLVLATTESQREAVAVVLEEFFESTPEGWINTRADQEIAAMREKQHKQREKANKRWHKPEAAPGNATASPTDAAASKADADAMPPTPTPTPTPNTSSLRSEVGTRKRATSRPSDVEEQTWSDWLALRKAKRAPVTDTVVEEARKEAGLAGLTLDAFLRVWCVRGSQGLRADWLKPAELQAARPAASAESFRERDERLAREKMAAFLPGIAAKGPAAASRNVIDITPALLAIGE